MSIQMKKGQSVTGTFTGANATNPNCPIQNLTASGYDTTKLSVSISGNTAVVTALDDTNADVPALFDAQSKSGKQLSQITEYFNVSDTASTGGDTGTGGTADDEATSFGATWSDPVDPVPASQS